MFKFIDIEELDEKELIQVLNHNKVEASFSRREIEKIKKIYSEKKEKTKSINYISNKEEKELEIDNGYEDEVEYYIEEIKHVKNDELISSLPSKNNNNYKKLMIRLQAESLKEIKEIKELYEEEIENFQEDDYKTLLEEISFQKERIDIIKKELERKNIVEEENKVENNKLLFLTTESGNVKALDELKKIPEEYYDSIKELFDTIIDGSFKNVKKFKGNDLLAGIAEVKNFKTRVIFDRVGKNEYVILTTFMKKTDSDKGYKDYLKRIVGDYKRQIDMFKRKSKDEEYMKIQEEITKELYNILGDEENNKVYSKEVINND